MIETNHPYCRDTDKLEHQVDPKNLISGRLGFYYCKQTEDDGHVDDRLASYGISRMGLAVEEPPCEQVTEAARAGVTETDHTSELVNPVEQFAEKFAGPCRRGSYKLSAKLIGWLRAIAKVTEKYQYEIVSEALVKHLAQLTAGLDADKTAEVANLRKEFEDFLADVDREGEDFDKAAEAAKAAEAVGAGDVDENADAKPKRTASNWFGFKGENQPSEGQVSK